MLLCDADLLFRQPIDELFDADAELLCCGDGPYLRGLSRNAAACADPHDDCVPTATLNAGFMLMDRRITGERPYAGLLALVTPETWGTSETTTDQLVLNRYFAGRLTPALVSWKYNYLLRYARRIRARDGLSWRGAKVLHFNLFPKPWLSQDSPAGRYASCRRRSSPRSESGTTPGWTA